ncbi:MAG TPA: 50S ribosomal protein L11 methyltransferase [Chthoniobacterales bacterium]|nr:50S ribosomal protein L11 methyltransferase [Chthoniobacterales bacterium]
MYIWRKHATERWLARHEADLAEFGSDLALIERPGKTLTLVEVSTKAHRDAVELRRRFGGAVEKLPTDWFKRFAREASAKPLRIGSRLVVLRTVVRRERKAEVISIPAEAAFGTGEHATTAMCLRILERITRHRPPGWTMLDAGTGSGILAIAARKFGAKKIVAVDNDPRACATASRNARANGVRNIEFRVSDVLETKLPGTFDVIAANLFSEVVIGALPRWKRKLPSEGRLILSGILRSQERMVRATLRRNRLAPCEIKRRGKWIAILAATAREKS